MGSEKLRIRIYEQQNNVKLLSKKGIQKSCLQVNYKLRTLASLLLCHAGVFQICFEISVFDFEKMLNNKIDDDSNIKVYVKIYWKKVPSHLSSCERQLHGPLVIIVNKVVAMELCKMNFAVLKIAGRMSQGSYRTVSYVSQYLDSISIVDHTTHR